MFFFFDILRFEFLSLDFIIFQTFQVIGELEAVAPVAITVELESKKITDFDEYMFGLEPGQNLRNPWFRDYWQKLTGCLHRNTTR